MPGAGIEPVVLESGQDWVAIIRETAPKHDVVGMAGGDGSRALVGGIAAEMGLPMVVVPAGTRNHVALDLGWTATTSSAASMPTARRWNVRWISPT